MAGDSNMKIIIIIIIIKKKQVKIEVSHVSYNLFLLSLALEDFLLMLCEWKFEIGLKP